MLIVMLPRISATPVPVCMIKPVPTMPINGPWLVPMMKLLASDWPPLIRRLGEVLESSVTSPVPNGALVVALMMFWLVALPPPRMAPPVLVLTPVRVVV